LYAATCRHCGREIVQHPSGVWIPRDGSSKSDPSGVYCLDPADERPRMSHEPMPPELAGAPRWLVPDSSRVGATAGSDAGSARRRIRAPRLRENVPMGLRRALVRLMDLARLRAAWW
jgi:hypothetical protein